MFGIRKLKKELERVKQRKGQLQEIANQSVDIMFQIRRHADIFKHSKKKSPKTLTVSPYYNGYLWGNKEYHEEKLYNEKKEIYIYNMKVVVDNKISGWYLK